MPEDKFSAVWVSHSSINDYLSCPRLYYLRAIYKDPKTGHKITHMQPPLALGQAVHEVIQSLSVLPAAERFNTSLFDKMETAWEKVAGKKGGFKTEADEKEYKDRARAMLQRVMDNPEPLLKKAVRINMDLPHYWLSEEENIILCGKIDWLQYDEASDSVHILDFKTGKNDEKEESLQLPIYNLLVTNCQKRACSGASYWYLDRDNEPSEVELGDINEAYQKVYSVAHRISLARKLDHFKCNTPGGCRWCTPMERIVKGQGEKVGLSEYNQDIYILT